MNSQLTKLDTYVEKLDAVKEEINNEIPELRYNGIDATTALKSIEMNRQTLHTIRMDVQQVDPSEQMSRNLIKIINLLENANLLYHDFADEKLRTGNNNMKVYDQIIDLLLKAVRDLQIARS